MDDFAAKNRAVAEEPVLLEQRSKASRNSHSGRSPDRWRAGLLVVFVIPAVLFASAVKLARASSYETHPILCCGVDYDTVEPVLCVLPEETTKKSSSAKEGPHPCGKVFCSAISRPRIIPAGAHLLMSSPDSPLRARRLLALRSGSPDDPNGPH